MAVGKDFAGSGHDDPRERLRAPWAELEDRAALEQLCALVRPAREAIALARRLLHHYGGLCGVLEASPEDLRAMGRLPEGCVNVICLVRATVDLYLQRKVETTDVRLDPSALESAWRVRLGSLPNEAFEVAYLDARHLLLRDGIERLQEGTIDRVVVYPRRVMEAALRRGAVALIVAHNHPNGRLEPSEHDKLLTRALVLAGETVGVEIFDHLVIGADSAFSFRKAGLL